MERTKVVATLGPASSSREVLGGMVEAGLDVVRLNFSHGERADHVARFELVRAVAAERSQNLAVLVDLQGPKIRVGVVDDNGVRLDR
ncbi:MAG TPA: pyruvate kinase, partial [Actinomycetota bacterium]|nr:pyruvate kinase [Actinomycetota bacterium]